MTQIPEKIAGTGIILAGGAGVRMGTEKALLSWNGEPLLAHVTRIVASVMSEVLVVGYVGKALGEEFSDVRFLQEPQKIGPLGGFHEALRMMGHEKALLVACDMPFITGGTIRLLWEQSAGFDVTIPITGEGLHPLFGVYSKDCLPEVEKAMGRGERKFITFYEGVRVKHIRTESDPELWNRVLMNLNSPEDYRNARTLR